MSLTGYQLAARIAVITLLSGLVFGCQLINPPPAGDIIIDDLELHSNSKQDEVIKLAILKLEQGEQKIAREAIDRVLRINNRHPTGQLLVRLLDEPAEEFFKTQRVIDYKIKSGDTLGSIAKTWLGNSLYFISLAQLNKIAKPTRIKPGMSLKIPVIELSPLVQKEIQRSKANLDLIMQLNSNLKYFEALEKMDQLYLLADDRAALSHLQVDALSGLIASAVSISDRYSMLEKVNALYNSSQRPELQSQYRPFIENQSYQILIDEFLLLLDDRSYLESADKLIAAKLIFEKHSYREDSDYKINELIIKLHEEAIIFRKNQDLDQAMLRWEKILTLEPNNELAKKYYSRTSKLLDKLKQLN